MASIQEIRAAREAARPQGGGNFERQPMTTLAIQVVKYNLDGDRPTVVGTRLDTGEEVTVFLRDYTQGGEFKRPEIADLAGDSRKNRVATDIGGILRVDNAYRTNDGSWSARWLSPLSHTPDEATVAIGLARVGDIRLNKNKEDYLIASVVLTQSATLVESEAALQETVVNVLGEGANSVAIRLIAEDGVEVVTVRTAIRKPNSREWENLQPADAWNAFAASEVGKVVTEALKTGLKAEVMSILNLSPGLNTMGGIKKDAEAGRAPSAPYKMGENQFGPITGYKEAIITVRQRENGDLYFTDITPVSRDAAPQSLEDAVAAVKTAAYTPAPAVPSADDAVFDAAGLDDIPGAEGPTGAAEPEKEAAAEPVAAKPQGRKFR